MAALFPGGRTQVTQRQWLTQEAVRVGGGNRAIEGEDVEGR